MTELLQFVMTSASRLPDERQDYIARALMNLLEVDASEPEDIDPEDLPGVLRGLEQAETGKLATSDEVEAVFRSFEE
jgi:predicted transcriptional regulator